MEGAFLPALCFAASAVLLKFLPSEASQEESERVAQPTVLEALQEKSKETPYYKFVLTGGPCGGKTTALARLSSFRRWQL